MVQARPFSDLSDSILRTDIFMVSDITGTNQLQNITDDNLQDKRAETNKSCEPDDLCMVLERDSTAVQTVASWDPEMDYENNTLASEVKISTDNEPANSFNDKGTSGQASEALKGKVASKEAQSLKHQLVRLERANLTLWQLAKNLLVEAKAQFKRAKLKRY